MPQRITHKVHFTLKQRSTAKAALEAAGQCQATPCEKTAPPTFSRPSHLDSKAAQPYAFDYGLNQSMSPTTSHEPGFL